MVKAHPIGTTIPMIKVQPVGAVKPLKMHPIGTFNKFKRQPNPNYVQALKSGDYADRWLGGSW